MLLALLLLLVVCFIVPIVTTEDQSLTPRQRDEVNTIVDERMAPILEFVRKYKVDRTSPGYLMASSSGSSSLLSPSSESSSSSSSPSNNRNSLRRKERRRWLDAVKVMRANGYSLKGFYHTSAWREYWSEIVKEQMMILDGRRSVLGDAELPYNESVTWSEPQGSSLLAVSDELYINIAGPDISSFHKIKNFVTNLTLSSRHRSKISFHFNKTIDRSSFDGKSEAEKKRLDASPEHYSEGEYSTVNALQKYCMAEVAAGRKSLVYYLHNKGACCYPKKSKQPSEWAVASWREVMNTFNLEFPSICLRALLSGYSTCGYGSQLAHYTGNYWWADCGHVAALPPLWSKFDAYAVEYFVMNVSKIGDSQFFGDNCAYETHHCQGDHYRDPCARGSYIHKLQSFVDRATLPRVATSAFSQTLPINITHPLTFCRNAWQKGPYAQQRGFNDWQHSDFRMEKAVAFKG
jgi:hypothetical protein